MKDKNYSNTLFKLKNSYKTIANGCWEWIGSCSHNGYGRMYLPETKKVEQAHRVSWKIFKGAIPNGLLVLHKCDNPPCINPEHLFLGTYKDNSDDKIKKGRANWGISPKQKNMLLENKIKENFISIRDFCKEHNLNSVTTYNYILKKKYPYTKHSITENKKLIHIIDGWFLKRSALKIVAALHCHPFNIFDLPPNNFESLNHLPLNGHVFKSIVNMFPEKKKNYISAILRTLKPREKEILEMRFGFYTNQMTLEEVSNIFGVTRERIRQIENRAIRKLRHPTRSKYLKKILLTV